MPDFSKMTKAALTTQLAELGETAPKAWTKAEIAARITEIQEDQGLAVHRGKVRTPLRHSMVELNQASRKKFDLQEFARNKMMLRVTGQETIAQLQKACISKIYATTTGQPEDPVGFGEHCSLTYEELKNTAPDYARWVVTTASEGECNPRLERLARWLETQTIPDKTMGKIIPKKTVPETKGYTGSGAGSEVSSSSTAQLEMMMNMAKMMSELKEEVEALRQERPRKKVESSTASMGSFTKVELDNK